MRFVQRRRFLWILFLVGIALAAVVANATTLKPLTFEELAQQSSAVARLRCLDSQSKWDVGEIWTETRFEVIEREKGLLKGIVRVRTLGGRVGNLYSRVDGVPVFRPGEEVYLFLWGQQGEAYRVLGWSQGTFRIVRDTVNRSEKITQDSASSTFDQRTRHFQGEGIRAMPLHSFQEKLRLALEASRLRSDELK